MPKEEIAIIGGGLGGCLTALMLAKDPKYHVTLIEGQNTLLNGASAIASRLHVTGREYPEDFETAEHCFKGGIIFKRLMPKDIYTPVPPMRFIIAENPQLSEEERKKETEELQKIYEKTNKEIKHEYIFALNKLKNFWRSTGSKEPDDKLDKKAENMLYGPADELFKELTAEDLKPYHGKGRYGEVVYGFQSKEPGINPPKLLAMIQSEIEHHPNITVLKNHKIVKNGIEGELGNFQVHYVKTNKKSQPKGPEQLILDEETHQPKKFSQVIMAAWRGNPEIASHLGKDEEGAPKKVTVFKRAMLLVDLPKKWDIPPAFIMKGSQGGMLSPYNSSIAVNYLPIEEAAYRKNITLDDDHPALPGNWDDLTQQDRGEWTQRYFNLLKERFPALEGAKNPRIVVRETLSFQGQHLEQRWHQPVMEIRPGLQQHQLPLETLNQEMRQEYEPYLPPAEVDGRPGVFTIYPTKATHGLRAAIQAKRMVDERSAYPSRASLIPTEDIFELILSPENPYSLADMREPSPLFYTRFFKEHPDLDPKMMNKTWHNKNSSDDPWAGDSLRTKPYRGRS